MLCLGLRGFTDLQYGPQCPQKTWTHSNYLDSGVEMMPVWSPEIPSWLVQKEFELQPRDRVLVHTSKENYKRCANKSLELSYNKLLSGVPVYDIQREGTHKKLFSDDCLILLYCYHYDIQRKQWTLTIFHSPIITVFRSMLVLWSTLHSLTLTLLKMEPRLNP